MLPKKNRIADSTLIEVLKKNSKKLSFGSFTLLFIDSKSAFPRFVFVVSKNVSKIAVMRNKVKRVFRHEVLNRLSDFPAKDYMFIIKRNALNNLSEIKNELNELLLILNR